MACSCVKAEGRMCNARHIVVVIVAPAEGESGRAHVLQKIPNHCMAVNLVHYGAFQGTCMASMIFSADVQ